VRDALTGFETLHQPGQMLRLAVDEWADDDAWKDGVMRPRKSELSNTTIRAWNGMRTRSIRPSMDRALAEAETRAGRVWNVRCGSTNPAA
jgi:hypothetical protein